MEILEAYDLTKTFWSAAELTGHDPKTIKRYVEARDSGCNPYERCRCREPHPSWLTGIDTNLLGEQALPDEYRRCVTSDDGRGHAGRLPRNRDALDST
jgi:hypothetical protein